MEEGKRGSLRLEQAFESSTAINKIRLGDTGHSFLECTVTEYIIVHTLDDMIID